MNKNNKDKGGEELKTEVYISVDIEADGPIPGDYSMQSLGACVVGKTDVAFYSEMKPISEKFDPEAAAVSGLDRNKLISDGEDPKKAMERFTAWLQEVCGPNGRPVFVGFNATFDWMFVYWYLIHFTGKKPFGISGKDIKAFYAGVMNKPYWWQTSKRNMDREFLSRKPHTHNALDDAREQADIYLKLRKKAGLGI